MDQKKSGVFLKQLRNYKKITQEQFAEIINVSNRTVSRWETGSNMPDLDTLILIADYYEVDIREIIDGERKSEKMNNDMKDTVLKVADYSNDEKRRITKRMHILFILGALGFVVFFVLDAIGLADTGFISAIAGFGLGFAFGMTLLGILYTSKYMKKFSDLKSRLIKSK